jgi:hypothetical protein
MTPLNKLVCVGTMWIAPVACGGGGGGGGGSGLAGAGGGSGDAGAGASEGGAAGVSGSVGAGGSAGANAGSGQGGNSEGGAAVLAAFSRLGTGDGFEGEDPVVMWADSGPALGYTIFDVGPRLHFFDDGQWAASVSDPTSGPGVLNAYRLTGFCSDGTSVYLAHTQIGDGAGDLNNHLFVYRYRASSWSLFGGGEVSLSAAVAFSPWEPGIACPAGDDPAVTWVQTPAPPGEDPKDAAGWVATLTSSHFTRSTALGSLTHPDYVTDVRVTSVAREAGGPAYVATWEDDGTGRQQLFVYGFDGAATNAIGASVGTDETAGAPVEPYEPAIAVDSGDPVVAWEAASDSDGTRDIFAARYDGSDWEPLGEGPIRGFGDDHFTSREPALVASDGDLYLAWAESSESRPMSIFVARWTGSDWERLGDVLNVDPERDTEDPSIAVHDGVLYVAFEEFVDGGRQIFVKAGAAAQ